MPAQIEKARSESNMVALRSIRVLVLSFRVNQRLVD